MADVRDRDRDRSDIRDKAHHQLQVHSQYPAGFKDREGGPTTSQIIALITLLPLSLTFLFLAGVTLVGSIIGLVITTPLFILFSPVLVPTALLIGFAVTGFLSSGAFGLTGMSSLSRLVGYLRQAVRRMPDELDYAKRNVADMVAYAGQKTKDAGQTIESKARESGGTTTTART